MDLEALRERLRALTEQMRGIITPPEDLTDDAARSAWEPDADALARFDQLDTEATALRGRIEDAERRLAAIAASDAAARFAGDDATGNRGGYEPPNINRGGDPFDLSTLRMDTSARDLRARAETALESDVTTEEWAREAAVRTLTTVRDNGQVASLALHTASPAYRRAFAKAVAGRMWDFEPDERAAFARAQSTSNTAGGFAVPFTLDPTVVLTNNGTINPIRGLARTVQITTDSWNGVNSAGATASWDAEGSEVSDDSITLAQPSVPVHKMRVFVPFSEEIGGDWMGIESDLRMVMVDARDRLEATAHIKGTGSGQPTGIETALDGTASEVAPLTGETFAVGDVYNVQRQVPPRYRASADMAAWVAALGTYNTIRQFDTGGGGSLWTQLGGGTPERLLGWRAYEASNVDDAVDLDAAATADNFLLFAGDWSRYLIVDRVGMSIELVPHLFHTATNRPSGQRGLYGWLRTGADSIDDNAFRVLSIPTTA